MNRNRITAFSAPAGKKKASGAARLVGSASAGIYYILLMTD